MTLALADYKKYWLPIFQAALLLMFRFILLSFSALKTASNQRWINYTKRQSNMADVEQFPVRAIATMVKV